MKNLNKNDIFRYVKLYTQVHCRKRAYTLGVTEQKEHIRIHTLPQEEKRIHVGKPRFWSEVFWSKVLIQGILFEVLTLGIWSKVLVLSGFGTRY